VSRYRCVDAQKAAGFPVVAACQAAGVSASAFYAWSASNRQEPSRADHKEVELVAEIRTIHRQSSGTYGSPRVHAELRRRGQRVNHCDDDGGGCGEGLTQSTTGLVPIA
jgi:putative transposase